MSINIFEKDFTVEIARAAIRAATHRGLAAAAAVSGGEGLSLTVRGGTIETLEHHRDKVLSVAVYDGQRKGTATTTEFTPAAIADTVDAAARIARYAQPDPYAGLIAPEYLAREVPDLDLDHPWALSAEAAQRLALECEAAARDADPEVHQVDESAVSHYRGVRAYADSQGFAASYNSTRHGISCTVVGSRHGTMQRGYWFSAARDADALEDPAAIGRTAAARAVARLGARKLSTRRAPVLFEARVATGLVGHLVAAASGGNLYRDASFLRDAAGSEVFPHGVTIEEDPHLRRAFGSAPFDAEGARTQARTLIDHGVLTGYLLDSYSARRLGLTPTGNAGGAHTLIVSDHGQDYAALVRQLDTGLVVNELMGFGVNLLTGDYSRGASGFWVEHGEIAYPVEEITIAGNLRTMFRSVVAIGNDREMRGSVRCGSILLDEMTIAGD